MIPLNKKTSAQLARGSFFYPGLACPRFFVFSVGTEGAYDTERELCALFLLDDERGGDADDTVCIFCHDPLCQKCINHVPGVLLRHKFDTEHESASAHILDECLGDRKSVV